MLTLPDAMAEPYNFAAGRKDAEMGRGYIKLEDIERIVGNEKVIRFCELMKEKFEESNKKERIKIEFIDSLIYSDYEHFFQIGEEVPETYDNLLILEEAIGIKLFGKLLDTFYTQRLSISYGLIKRKLICNDLQNGMSVKQIAQKYNVDVATVYRNKKKLQNGGSLP